MGSTNSVPATKPGHTPPHSEGQAQKQKRQQQAGAARAKTYDSIIDVIGNTPLVRINRLAPTGVTMYAKLEAQNPGGSVKDRMAAMCIEAAEKEGRLKPGQTVVECTSGNTGIGLAVVCAAKGYPLVCVMSESFSVERRKIMRFYGARVVLTPAHLKGAGMLHKAQELEAEHGWFNVHQFENESNARAHELHTGPEIVAALGGKGPDYFVTGSGTGGTFLGVGTHLRKVSPATKICMAEPDNSALLYSDVKTEYQENGVFKDPHPVWRPHLIQGWTPDWIPKLVADGVENVGYDCLLQVGGHEAMRCARELAVKEGIFTGVSGGATLAAALEVAAKAEEGAVVVFMVPDTAERYLSTPLFEGISADMNAEELEISRSTPLYRFDVQQAPPQAPTVEATDDARNKVREVIKDNAVAIFSLQYCEFCWSATKFFEAAGIPFEVLNVDELRYVKGAFGGKMRTALAEISEAKTFPQVFIGGEFVGGATDVFNQFKDGSLQPKLKETGVEWNTAYSDDPYNFLPKWLHAR